MTQPRTRASKIIRRESCNSDLSGVLLDNVPDYLLSHFVAPNRAGSANAPEHRAYSDASRLLTTVYETASAAPRQVRSMAGGAGQRVDPRRFRTVARPFVKFVAHFGHLRGIITQFCWESHSIISENPGSCSILGAFCLLLICAPQLQELKGSRGCRLPSVLGCCISMQSGNLEKEILWQSYVSTHR
jgi:hypothetical protein